MAMQATVFEEIATMDFPFEGIPTVPPRKDVDHMVDISPYLEGHRGLRIVGVLLLWMSLPGNGLS